MKKSKKELLAEMLDMPKEILIDTPKITVYSDNQVIVENYSGILEYTGEYIRLKTAEKIIAISGKNLELKTITDMDVLIEGSVKAIEYV